MDIVVWFSCGAASAVAAIETIKKYGADKVRIVNTPIKEEHEDNIRFLKDIEEHLNVSIETATNTKYNGSCKDVWTKRKYMSGVSGAICTYELKKKARYAWQERNLVEWHVLGFTYDEKHRHDNFIRTEMDNVLPILIDLKLTKQNCVDYLNNLGIRLPEMYYLGYPNANCIGCVKATSPTYWNKVRETHPDVFAERSALSRKLGVRLVRVKGTRIFLDELKLSDKGKPLANLAIECGAFCEEL